MKEIKIQTQTTVTTNFFTDATQNQNPQVLLENHHYNYQNPPALFKNHQYNYQNPPAFLENHQYNYYYAAGAAASSKAILGNSKINAYYIPNLPPGFRFKPTGEELISQYLQPKLENKKLIYPTIRIHDADIYKEGPSYFSAKYAAANEVEWYFLSPREKKHLKGSRPNRVAGNGYWKATGSDKSIVSSKDKVQLGVVKTLVYYRGPTKNASKTSWIMKEYRVKNSPPSSNYSSSNNSMKLDDYVLCKIYQHKSKKSNDTNDEGGEADDQVEPDEDFHDGVAQQLDIHHQDHEPGHIFFVTENHINQQNYVDNIREIDNSAGQQQQQQLWPIPNSNYLARNDPVFPNDMPMLVHPMHGNVFYPQNRNLMLHGTLCDQQTVSGHGRVYDYIPQEFPHHRLPGADAAFNNVQALNNESNNFEGFSPRAVPPVADASNYVQAFKNEMQQPRYQNRLVRVTRPPPSSSSRYHPYHHSSPR